MWATDAWVREFFKQQWISDAIKEVGERLQQLIKTHPYYHHLDLGSLHFVAGFLRFARKIWLGGLQSGSAKKLELGI